MVVPVHYQVHLPVPEACAVRFGGALVDARAVGNGHRPGPWPATVLHPMARVAGQHSGAVGSYHAVYGLMGDPETFPGEVSGNLPRGPLLLDDQLARSLHQQWVLGAVGRAPLASLPSLGLRCPGMVVPARCAVALELAREG